MRKAVLTGLCAAVLAAVVRAGEYATLAVAGSDVALTNAQANSAWTLDGVLFKFTTLPAAGSTVTVARVSGGVEYVLSASTNVAASLWWAADGTVTFRQGDALRLYCGGATGTVQVMQGAGLR